MEQLFGVCTEIKIWRQCLLDFVTFFRNNMCFFLHQYFGVNDILCRPHSDNLFIALPNKLRSPKLRVPDKTALLLINVCKWATLIWFY